MKIETDFGRYISIFFEQYLPLERGVSKHTIRSYSDTFTLFFEFMGKVKRTPPHKLTLSLITRDVIIKFLDWVEQIRNCSATTRNIRLAAIHAFCYFLQYKDIQRLGKWQDILSIKSKRTAQSHFSHLSQEGVTTLLSVIRSDSFEERRHLAIIAFLYDTGARAQELIDVTPKDLSFSNPAHVMLFGKGRKKRLVPLQEKMCAILKAYMKDRGIDETEVSNRPLFTNIHGRKLTSAGLTHIINMYADIVRVKYPDTLPDKISPHSLRHSKAMHLLQAGVNIIYVRDLLGHASIKTTEIYARADTKLKREALKSAYSELIPQSPSEHGKWEQDQELKMWLRSLGR